MGLTAWGYGLAALAYTAFAVALVRGYGLESVRRSTASALIAAVALSAVWAWTSAAGEPAGALGPPRLQALLDIARYGLWFFFLLRIGRSSERGGRRSSALTGGALVLVAACLLLAASSGSAWGHRLGTPLLFSLLALPVFGLVLVEQLFRSVPEDFRWNAKPLCLALLCLFVFDIYLYSQVILFGKFDEDTLLVRAPVSLIACALLFASSRRSSGWMGTLQVSHSAALHTATLVLVGIYLVFISAIGYYIRNFGGDVGRALQLALLFLALVVLAALLASSSLRARLRVQIGKNFFSYRYDYRTEWLRFTAMLTVQGSASEVGSVVVRGLAGMAHSKAGALWTASIDQRAYVQVARWGMNASAATEPVSSTFARFLREREWIVDIEEYRASPARYEGLELPAWLLESRSYWLVVPLIGADQLVGIVVLSKGDASPTLDWEVRDLLKTAARQAAAFMAQVQATEALLEARKFDAFNRMSAFVVHDLKNIVAQLSLMMQNAKRLHDNPEFRQDMLITVEHSLDKMRQLMLQLREGNAPVGVALGVEMAPIVNAMQALAQGRGRVLEVTIIDVVTARGDDARISRVIGHLVQNALDATSAGDRVWLSIERDHGSAKIVVGDNGCGMTPEFMQTRLFKPFNTTKESGMGIGVYESYQYIHELGGRIDVVSEVGKGTVVSVMLPLFLHQSRSDAFELASS